MMDAYITSDDDTIDQIAFKHYGSIEGRVVERVYLVNPGLAEYGPSIPAGVTVWLPVLDAAVTAKTTGHKLWA